MRQLFEDGLKAEDRSEWGQALALFSQVVTVKVSPSPYSPHGDRVKDVASITVTTSELVSLVVGITNAVGKLIKALVSGQQVGPGTTPLEWHGRIRTNGKWHPVADGIYTYRLVVRDAQGRMLDSPVRRVTISTAGPQGDVPITVNPSNP